MKKREYHGGTGTRLYRIWSGMKSRCNIPSASGYEYYGARGIKVSEEWSEFSEFKKWAELNGYQEELTIERIDRSGNYCPDNCKWITWSEQQSNTSQNILIPFNSKTQTLTQWAKELNVKEATLRYRYHKGLPLEQVLSTEDRRSNPEYYNKQPRKNRHLRIKEVV